MEARARARDGRDVASSCSWRSSSIPLVGGSFTAARISSARRGERTRSIACAHPLVRTERPPRAVALELRRVAFRFLGLLRGARQLDRSLARLDGVVEAPRFAVSRRER